jgi:hypothetical protein
VRYHDGSAISLGDLVTVPIPSGVAKARVVMLGDTYEHLDIDAQFLSWVKSEKILKDTAVVIEWIGDNPFAHNDPQYAPVGNYMFSPVDEWLKRDA